MYVYTYIFKYIYIYTYTFRFLYKYLHLIYFSYFTLNIAPCDVKKQ